MEYVAPPVLLSLALTVHVAVATLDKVVIKLTHSAFVKLAELPALFNNELARSCALKPKK